MPVHEPVFLNEGTSASELELKKLESIRGLVKDEDKERLEQEIRLVRAGIAGEKKIIFELMNSHYPLAFIHDLNLRHEGTSAQIDFLVVTPCNMVVIECKNMVGNIEVDSSGAFVRTFGSGKYRRREGVYSPITQNERHIELMKAIVRSEHGAFVQFAQRFILDDLYHSIVVLANEKTVLDAKDAPEEVRSQIVRADQLVGYIRELDKRYAKKNDIDRFAAVEKTAQRWLKRNKPSKVNVASRYELVLRKPKKASDRKAGGVSGEQSVDVPKQSVGPAEKSASGVPTCPLCGAPMVLRTARYGKNKGNKFWGCSTYGTTRCKGIVEVG
jgi:hypothetical protein